MVPAMPQEAVRHEGGEEGDVAVGLLNLHLAQLHLNGLQGTHSQNFFAVLCATGSPPIYQNPLFPKGWESSVPGSEEMPCSARWAAWDWLSLLAADSCGQGGSIQGTLAVSCLLPTHPLPSTLWTLSLYIYPHT